MPPRPTGRNYRLSAEDVRTAVVSSLQESLELSVEGRVVNAGMVLDVLVYAAATRQSIHSSCEALSTSADDNTIREYVNEVLTLENLDPLEEAVNTIFAHQVPRKVRRGRWDVACDTHDQPFYGKTAALLAMTCRGKAHDGTTHFFRIATVCLLVDGIRLTLALHFIRPGEDMPSVMRGLLERAQLLTGGIRCLYADKGFASIEVYRLLDEQNLSALIACPIRGKEGGTRALCKGYKSYSTTHTFHNTMGGYMACVSLVRVFHEDKPYEKALEWRLYVRVNNTMTPNQIRAAYRRRFGIESSYRSLNQTRANTTTKNAALRFFFMALALILVNTWIILRFGYCQVPRRGRLGRFIDESRFRLHTMTTFLRYAIEQHYGLCTSISASCLPLPYD